MRILFVTWDGPGLNYLESLYLPIFERLKAHDAEFDVLQFSWGKQPTDQLKSACERAGVRYMRGRILRHPRPFGPFLSAILGGWHIARAARLFRSDVVMPRSIMPAIAALSAERWLKLPIFYDADGLAADERVDFAGLPEGSVVYRTMTAAEARIVRAAKAVIVRSKFAAEILRHRAGSICTKKFFVVANGRDSALFQPADPVTRQKIRNEIGIPPSAPVVIHVGSVGGKYDTARIGSFMQAVLAVRPDARLLIVSNDLETAKRLIFSANEKLKDLSTFISANPSEVSRYVFIADVGTAFIRPSFSMRAVAPIKTAEYLMSGVPVVGTVDVGDTKVAENVGVFFNDALGDGAAASWLAQNVLPNREVFRQRARSVGLEQFSLDRAESDYANALEFLRTAVTERRGDGSVRV